MKKVKNIVVGGIENKIFNLIIVTVFLVSLVFGGVALYQARMLSAVAQRTSEQQVEAIAQMTGAVMEETVRETMSRTTRLEGLLADEVFSQLKSRVMMAADYAASVFSNPEAFSPAPCAPPDAARDGEVCVQLLLAEGVSKEGIQEKLGLAAGVSEMMASMLEVSFLEASGQEGFSQEGSSLQGAAQESARETSIDSLFLALPEGAFVIADDRPSSKFDTEGKPLSYDPRTRFWYEQAILEGGPVFSDAELDAFTGKLGIVCAAPVYANGELAAVVGADLFLSSMEEAIQSSAQEGGFLFVAGGNGHVIFSPAKEGLLAPRHSGEALDLRETENEEFSALVRDALSSAQDPRRVELEGTSYYMAGVPLPTVGWALLAAYDAEAAGEPSRMLQARYLEVEEGAVASFREGSARARNLTRALLLLVLALSCASAVVLGRKIVRPLNTIVKRIAALGEDHLEFTMEDEYRTGDEIEVLAQSFADLSHRTVRYVHQVREITAQKERVSTELHMANQIQESMLPNTFPAFPDRPEFEIYATMEPAREVGGDFYDFFLIDPDHLCLVIADVSGKGVPAALFMMISKVILQSCAMLGRSAAEILTKTNEALCSSNKVEMFVTVWLGILEISTGKLTAANAGHEYPALQQGGGLGLYKDAHGFVIGGMAGMRYKEYELQLSPGDKIFVYTDGIPEASNEEEEMFGTERMVEALNRAGHEGPEGVLQSVRRAVAEFVGGAEQFDDMTMLCLEYKGSQKGDEEN